MSRFVNSFSCSFGPESATPNSTSVVIATALVTFAAVTISRFAYKQKKVKIIRSPVTTLLPRLTQAEKDDLPYPPDAYPSARYVDSPYGTIKVYEWGPEEGRKVLFVHGATATPPADLPHDERLYSTQILLAITSSPLSWTGESGFSLIGYSLGGGISAEFTSYFPNLITSLVLLAPTGLIRAKRMAAQKNLIFFAQFIPDFILESFVKKRLQRPMFPNENRKQSNLESKIDKLGDSELESETPPSPNIPPVSLKYPAITVIPAIQWQIRHHIGFFTSFMSTIRYAPISDQQESWKRLRLRKDKILIIAASHDPIIDAKELREDAIEALGVDRFEWRVIDGAHDITISHPREIVDEICGRWGI